MNDKEYRDFLEMMYQQSMKIGAAQERMKDKMCKEEDIECQISIKGGEFHVMHDNKIFKCYTGEQLISYLKSIKVSDRRLLGLQEALLFECMRRGMKPPEDLML